ncbi:hypothetical protein WAF17_03830 [Bernardetia sp. ABR2-2B]|uniref:hypothetical protein n=1 Tax=Bernardetia sp. ABR2-2B TaxID=3127472 RepID=UPI0030CAFAA6
MAKTDKRFIYAIAFISFFTFMFGWESYNYLLYYHYLKTNNTELVEGRIEKLTREYWDIERAAQEKIKVKNITFSYYKNDNGFYPSYHAELPDSVLYEGKYVKIRYIVQGDRNLILSIEE